MQSAKLLLLIEFSFQSFSQYRAKMSKKTDEEIETLKRNPTVSIYLFIF